MFEPTKRSYHKYINALTLTVKKLLKTLNIKLDKFQGQNYKCWSCHMEYLYEISKLPVQVFSDKITGSDMSVPTEKSFHKDIKAM